MSARPVQYFSDEALAAGAKLSPEQVLRFLEDFRRMHAAPKNRKARPISLRVPEELLAAFKAKSDLENVSYQTQIKRLMSAWVDG